MSPGIASEKRHKCLIYDREPSEQLPVIVPFIADGLRDDWRCLYLGDPTSVRVVASALADRQIDPDRESKRGALIFSSDRSHLTAGKFDPKAMVEAIGESIDEALDAGFKGLCATGDMKWELGDDDNFDCLVEYEARLEQLFRDKPLRGVCQYRRDLVPERAIRDALVTHSAAYIGGLDVDNFFYVPPDLLLAPQDGAAALEHGEWMCRQLVRVLEAERARDAAIAELRESTRLLRRAVAARDDFLAMASHELRTPVMPLLLTLQGMDKQLRSTGAPPADIGARVEGAVRHVERVRGLVDHLLDVARINMGALELTRRRLDLGEIVRAVVRRVRDTTRSPSEVTVLGPPALVGFWDEAGLDSIVTNLLGNALKYGNGKPVEVAVARAGAIARLSVTDHGLGIAAEDQARIFGRFERAVPSQSYGGLGLGLWVVRSVVEAHGGTIGVSSAKGSGSTFVVELPLGAGNHAGEGESLEG